MILMIIGGIIGLALVFGVIYYNTSPQMGAGNGGYDGSPNYKDGKFQNFLPTPMISNENYSFIGGIYEYLFKNDDGRFPSEPLKTVKLNSSKEGITWLGHSTVLLKLKEITIITDPVLNPNRLPPLYMGPKPFPYTNSYSFEDLPKIDAVLISHDHMDHLDLGTVKKLKNSTFYVPLGTKPHLLKWGIKEENIKEMDWYDEAEHKGTKLVLTPARHFGSRGIFNRDTTFWGSWVIKNGNRSIYFGGDSGYFDEFKKIGEKFGPFDIVMLDSGQYDNDWKYLHLLPDEVIQATIDLKAEHVLPIHICKYVLARHSWHAPLDAVTAEGKKKNVSVITPQIGQTFSLDKDLPEDRWWRLPQDLKNK